MESGAGVLRCGKGLWVVIRSISGVQRGKGGGIVQSSKGVAWESVVVKRAVVKVKEERLIKGNEVRSRCCEVRKGCAKGL